MNLPQNYALGCLVLLFLVTVTTCSSFPASLIFHVSPFIFSPFFLKFVCASMMSDQSDSQNNLSDSFMSESEPSFPLFANKSPSSSDSSLSERRTGLVADIPPTYERKGNVDLSFLMTLQPLRSVT